MKLRTRLIAVSVLLGATLPAQAQVSVGIEMPGLSIGVNMPTYPELVAVPGYPVYYAPRAGLNYFFYDGMYWVYQNDNWYASSWYNGPWQLWEPEMVPLFVLRVPVRYYRQPPVYFQGWRRDAPPHWGEHWGRGWEDRHRGWDHWDRRSAPRPAPLPVYQRQYSGARYPRDQQQQHAISSDKYHYQPHEGVTRQHVEQARDAGAGHAGAAARPDMQRGQGTRQHEQVREQHAPPALQVRPGERYEEHHEVRHEVRQYGEQPRPQNMGGQGRNYNPGERAQGREQAPEAHPQQRGKQHEQDREHDKPGEERNEGRGQERR
jgi:hypothetical protein